MMKVLITSCRFPTDLKRDVQGTFRRFNLFLDAFKAIAQLDILFYVPEGIDVSPLAIAQQEKALSAHWDIPIKLSLCPQRLEGDAIAPNSGTAILGAKVRRQFAPIFDFTQQRTFFSTSGPQQIAALEHCLDRQPDAIFCHRLEAMTPLLKTARSLPPLFFDLDDVEHISFARQIRQPPTRLATNLYYLQIPALWWGERRSLKTALRSFVCSQLDQQYLAQRWRLKGVVNVPNAVSMPVVKPLSAEPTLMFLGGYYYFPNLNAANFLIEQVWPLIHQANPSARLIMAGSHPENIRSYPAAVPGVEFTGFVEDLSALYARSRIVCCPILSGGGTRVKIVEAAAYGKPIVSTPIGVEGLSMQDGENALIRQSPVAIAEACLTLLNSDALCEQLGAAARGKAIRDYDRTQVIQQIQSHVQSALSPSAPTESRLSATLQS